MERMAETNNPRSAIGLLPEEEAAWKKLPTLLLEGDA